MAPRDGLFSAHVSRQLTRAVNSLLPFAMQWWLLRFLARMDNMTEKWI